MKFITRSLFILVLLYGLVFAVGDLYLAKHGAPLWLAVVFAVGLIAVQYLVSPSVIDWVFPIQWNDGDYPLAWDLPDASKAFLERLCGERRTKRPRVGIIQSGTPNAFSYGHTPGDARVVVTTGLIDVLTPDELNAVIAHEVGHIEHWDFVVMSIAAVVPLLLYQMYIFLNHDKNGRAVAYAAYVCYIVSQFVVLTLNRTREYFADHYSAGVTHAPDELASALVKIACGLVRAEGEYGRAVSEKRGSAAARREHRLGGALAVMGISNVRSGTSLALGGADPVSATRAMRWDLVNPWARVYELQSTHPLTALRVRALGDDARAMNRAPRYTFPDAQPRSNLLFPLEFLVWAAPGAAAVLLMTARVAAPWLHRFGITMPPIAWPPIVLFIGLTWTARVLFRYRGSFEDQAIGRLIEDTDVSEMRPRAVRIRGEILGRGVPGAFWSPDLVIRDGTGMLFVLYRQSIPFARMLFATTSVEDLTGREVTIDGWYRRGMRPYVEMSRLTTSAGQTHRAYSRWVQLGLAAAAVVVAWMNL